jgi:hypothetical protein
VHITGLYVTSTPWVGILPFHAPFSKTNGMDTINSIHSSGIPTNVASSCMFSSCCLFLPLAAHHCSVKASTKTTQQAKNSSVRDVSFSSQKYAQRKTCRIQSHITVMTQASVVPYLGLSTVALCDAYNPRLVIHITSKA